MEKRVEFKTQEEREKIINENSNLILIGEHNLFEGDFLLFSDKPLKVEKIIIYENLPKLEFEELKTENTLLKAQGQANADVIDFHEEVLAEIILAIVP